ncbi:DUF397 domain-containing protein [Streptomyces sp. NPDC002209]|uniref:DUF397 domain-containing protein n=1 Tax=Streptomyces sp. NPDC002209 TaxID=3364638 RepID=UPI0036B230D2
MNGCSTTPTHRYADTWRRAITYRRTCGPGWQRTPTRRSGRRLPNGGPRPRNRCADCCCQWFKSSYSNGGDANCLEVCPLPGSMRVRDSKCNYDPGSGSLAFSAMAWTAFADHVSMTP